MVLLAPTINLPAYNAARRLSTELKEISIYTESKRKN